MVFDKSLSISYLQVIFRAIYWLQCWVQLQKCEDDKEIMKVACRRLETTVTPYLISVWSFILLGVFNFILNYTLHLSDTL